MQRGTSCISDRLTFFRVVCTRAPGENESVPSCGRISCEEGYLLSRSKSRENDVNHLVCEGSRRWVFFVVTPHNLASASLFTARHRNLVMFWLLACVRSTSHVAMNWRVTYCTLQWRCSAVLGVAANDYSISSRSTPQKNAALS